jgi:hypothetical protein
MTLSWIHIFAFNVCVKRGIHCYDLVCGAVAVACDHPFPCHRRFPGEYPHGWTAEKSTAGALLS